MSKKIFPLLGIGAGLLIAPAMAQHEGHQAPAPAASAKSDMCGKMMADKDETAKLIEQVGTSFAAVEAEKDPVALRDKLAAHGTLVKQLQAKLDGQKKMESEMKSEMKKMMGGSKSEGATEHQH
jgi:hypothetical protein